MSNFGQKNGPEGLKQGQVKGGKQRKFNVSPKLEYATK